VPTPAKLHHAVGHDPRQNVVSAYVDIKTVFESATVDAAVPAYLASADIAISENGLQQILLYRAFIRAVFTDIKRELNSQVVTGPLDWVLERVGLKKSDISTQIDELLEGSFEAQITDVSAFKAVVNSISSVRSAARKATSGNSLGGEIDHNGPSFSGKRNRAKEISSGLKDTTSEEYSQVLLRTFNINGIIEEMADLLEGIGVKHLYIFIDDCSELPEEAMRVFVDTVLGPLNNWSNELIKFKVAAYPGRIYYGKIDPTKVDEVYLDLFRLYGDKDVSTMEEKAIDFTKRLIDSRFSYFVGKSFSEFCDSDSQEIYRQLFFASMANPRILGHLLSNLRDSVTAYGQPIGTRAIQDASAKYYEDKIEPFFGMQKFSLESFEERASTFSLKALLESIVERAKSLRDYKDSRVTSGISGRTPSSHFHISNLLEQQLRTLELNFFMTLYYEMKDRDGKKVSVYALNHGLCNKYTISFGRPAGHRDYRLYFVERIFDYTSIVRRFLESNQEIKCNSCGEIYGLDKLEGLVMYDMLCPKSKAGTCEVINLSKKYESILQRVDPALMLPSTELGILEALYTEERDMVAADIAGELDCSYQLVGKRGRNLADRGLVRREKNEANRRIFSITDEARNDYFEGNAERALDVD
jgi:DNA-binding MarR family transcriptional regulator